ncbi:MAG: hypothetical protein HZA20_04035 [Nitrospirae bacterium]|nr:hypothetical protein [Nitrospirota bacterium]
MNKILQRLLPVALLILVSSCATADPYGDVRREFDAGILMVGIGDAAANAGEEAARRKAASQARRDLAGQIRVRIENVMLVEFCSGESGLSGASNTEACRSRVAQVVKTAADESLVNATISRHGIRGDKIFAVAVMERDEINAVSSRVRAALAKPPR